jgi:hypothetical protein
LKTFYYTFSTIKNKFEPTVKEIVDFISRKTEIIQSILNISLEIQKILQMPLNSFELVQELLIKLKEILFSKKKFQKSVHFNVSSIQNTTSIFSKTQNEINIENNIEILIEEYIKYEAQLKTESHFFENLQKISGLEQTSFQVKPSLFLEQIHQLCSSLHKKICINEQQIDQLSQEKNILQQKHDLEIRQHSNSLLLMNEQTERRVAIFKSYLIFKMIE